MSAVFKGQVGVTIKLNLGIDISASGTARIHYKKPDGTTGVWAATIDDASMGLIQYRTTAAADLDQNGVWKFNGEWDPDDPPADVHYGETACLRIFDLGECNI